MIKLHYFAGNKNFGDALSPMLVDRLSGESVQWANPYQADMVAVGSVMYTGHWLFRDADHNRKLRGRLSYLKMKLLTRKQPIKVWGTGFMEYPCVPARVAQFRKIDVCALRGSVTHKILTDLGLLSAMDNVVYGDPGLLYPTLLTSLPAKKYELGLMLHYFDKEAGRDIMEALAKYGLRVTLIDAVSDNPLETLVKIAECETVLSSAMHGCIVADGFGIPNLPLFISSHGLSDRDYRLKYDDYYSAFGMSWPKSVGMNEAKVSASTIVRRIKREYVVSNELVAQKQQMLKESFPYRCNEE